MLSSLSRLCYAFNIPLEHWFTSSILSFPAPRPIPDVSWLMDRAKAVDPDTVESALKAAVESPHPMSLFAVAKAIPASHSHLFHAYPDLAKSIADRYRQHQAVQKVAYAAKMAKLVSTAIAECVAAGRAVTADSVKKQLGTRWPLSRRRIRAVFHQVTGGPRERAGNALVAAVVPFEL